MTKTTLAAELAEELRHDTNWTSEDASNWLGRRRDALLAALTTNPAAPADGLARCGDSGMPLCKACSAPITELVQEPGCGAALSEARSCCEAERERDDLARALFAVDRQGMVERHPEDSFMLWNDPAFEPVKSNWLIKADAVLSVIRGAD